jgi:hypothetical protein
VTTPPERDERARQVRDVLDRVSAAGAAYDARQGA